MSINGNYGIHPRGHEDNSNYLKHMNNQQNEAFYSYDVSHHNLNKDRYSRDHAGHARKLSQNSSIPPLYNSGSKSNNPYSRHNNFLEPT
jgi:hypothetical protein